MFEVVIIKEDGSKETYDALTEMQAECILFRARMKPETQYVELNEVVEDELD
jgi:hypothetical protein